MIRPTDRKVFVVWAPYSRRSQSLAAELGLRLCLIHHLQFQRPLYAPLKYVLQALHTLTVLIRERPAIVFVQDPPIFASLVVWFYTILTRRRARFIVDAHSGALLHPWWQALRGLQRFVYRRALTVITTNDALTNQVHAWGACSLALAGPPIQIPPGKATPLGQTFNLVLINTFSPDEPLPAVLQAVADQPNLRVYVTGDVRKVPASYWRSAPKNVTFTGFLPDADYLSLLRGADAIMSLTNDDYTLQLGGMEAVAVGKPVITSDWPVLREYFRQGAVFVANTPESVLRGVIEARQSQARLSAESRDLHRAQCEEWQAAAQYLRELMSNGVAS